MRSHLCAHALDDGLRGPRLPVDELPNHHGRLLAGVGAPLHDDLARLALGEVLVHRDVGLWGGKHGEWSWAAWKHRIAGGQAAGLCLRRRMHGCAAGRGRAEASAGPTTEGGSTARDTIRRAASARAGGRSLAAHLAGRLQGADGLAAAADDAAHDAGGAVELLLGLLILQDGGNLGPAPRHRFTAGGASSSSGRGGQGRAGSERDGLGPSGKPATTQAAAAASSRQRPRRRGLAVPTNRPAGGALTQQHSTPQCSPGALTRSCRRW